MGTIDVKKTNRLVVFASYDKDSIIDDYVVYYLKKLYEIGDIIFVADCKYPENELKKIRPFVIRIIAKKHGEYDFGSYKIGYKYARENNLFEKYDWLVLCNDSVYGPFYPLSEIFEKMENKSIDIWGFSKNTLFFVDHLQSYFISMSKPIFLDKRIKNFFSGITRKSKKEIVREYETGLSRIVLDLGYRLNGFFENDFFFNYDPQGPYFLEIIKKGFPFLKRQLFNSNTQKVPSLYRYTQIAGIVNGYDIKMIEKNLQRVVGKDVLDKNLYLEKKFFRDSRCARKTKNIIKRIMRKYFLLKQTNEK